MNIPTELLSSIELTKEAKLTENAHLFGAFPENDVLTLRLTLPRALGVWNPEVEFYRDDDGAKFTLPFVWKRCDYVREVYECPVPMGDLCVSGSHDALLWYTLLLPTLDQTLRLSCNPHSYKPVILPAVCDHRAYQLTVYRKGSDAPKFIRGGILYHIFVDRFAKGGDVPVREDAILNPDWENGVPQYAEKRGGFVANNLFFGGTLYGIIDKLDYLFTLGVTVLYLSPIFRAYSNHKYDTGDYMQVDEMFGGEAALDLLIEKARRVGISIILDGVFNHTGSDSRYFNKNGRYDSVGAYQSKDSPYYDWYTFYDYPDKYRCWWDIDILPAVNSTNPAYMDYIYGEKGVARHYLRKGIAGWRLDVADELDSAFLDGFRKAVKAVKPSGMIYGEVWEDASDKIAYGSRRKYFRGGQLDSVMNYPLKDGIIRFVRDGDKNALFEATALLYAHYPKWTSDTLMNLLGTHDTERILTVLGGDPDGGRTGSELAVARMTPDQRARAKEMLKLCYILCATLPGVPCIYYGDEAGMEGYRDPFNRMPYPWDRQDTELLEFYRVINMIRRTEDLFADGYFEVDESTPEGVFAYRRFDGKAEIYVAVNRSDREYRVVKAGENLLDGEIGQDFRLPAFSACILRVE